MDKRLDLKKILSSVREPIDGDVLFVGEATKIKSELDRFIDSLLQDSDSSKYEPQTEEYVPGYLLVDKNGRIVKNSMENYGVFSKFLRRCGLAGPDKDWYKTIKVFSYSEAFRFQGKILKRVNGNLYMFCIDPSENVLRDLDSRLITEFLKVGDYSSEGKISIY